MEKIKSRLTITVIALFCVCYVSCSSDDEKNATKTEAKEESNLPVNSIPNIIGTWRCDWGEDPKRNYSAYSFFEDGTCLYFDKGNPPEKSSYTCDSDLQAVFIEDIWGKMPIPINVISDDVLMFGGEEYRKNDLTFDMLILGGWLLHVNEPNSTTEKNTIVTFNCDGTYIADDYIKWDKESSLEDHIGTFKGTYTIIDKTIDIKGESQIVGNYVIDELSVEKSQFTKERNTNEFPNSITVTGSWYYIYNGLAGGSYRYRHGVLK